jgi:hypothetical protein
MGITLHKYNCCDFHEVDKIGVICRGKSLGAIGKYKDNFKNTFVIGQHVKSFQMVGKHLENCNIVKIWGSSFHKPCKKEREICSHYNIRDLQSTLRPYSSERKAYKYKKIKTRYDGILETYPLPVNIHDRNKRILHKRKLGNGKLSYPTLGIFGVDLASAYNPKEVHVIGLDFYNAPYLTNEKLNANFDKNVRRGPNMIEFFKLLCKEETDIKFYLYTCCKTIKSEGNLKVTHV